MRQMWRPPPLVLENAMCSLLADHVGSALVNASSVRVLNEPDDCTKRTPPPGPIGVMAVETRVTATFDVGPGPCALRAFVTNAIIVPSGDHAGRSSSEPGRVSRGKSKPPPGLSGLPPVAWTQMS